MIHGTHNALKDARNEHVKISINGEYFDRKEAKISVFDSGYLVGDGVWEAFRVKQNTLLFVDQHLDRLWRSAKAIGMSLPFDKDSLLTSVRDMLKVNGMSDGVHVRVMVTRGIKSTPSQDPRLTVSGPNVVIIAEYKTASDETRTKGIRLFTSTVRRGSPDYLDPRLNCHSKLHEVQALIQALEAGADEALMLDVQGFVATCNATNFFIIQGGELWTSTGQYCMNGITRANVIKVCQNHGITCHQKNFSLFDVYGADEAFVTGTFGGVTPVVNIDGREMSGGIPGDITKKIAEFYQDLVLNEVEVGRK